MSADVSGNYLDICDSLLRIGLTPGAVRRIMGDPNIIDLYNNRDYLDSHLDALWNDIQKWYFDSSLYYDSRRRVPTYHGSFVGFLREYGIQEALIPRVTRLAFPDRSPRHYEYLGGLLYILTNLNEGVSGNPSRYVQLTYDFYRLNPLLVEYRWTDALMEDRVPRWVRFGFRFISGCADYMVQTAALLLAVRKCTPEKQALAIRSYIGYDSILVDLVMGRRWAPLWTELTQMYPDMNVPELLNEYIRRRWPDSKK